LIIQDFLAAFLVNPTGIAIHLYINHSLLHFFGGVIVAWSIEVLSVKMTHGVATGARPQLSAEEAFAMHSAAVTRDYVLKPRLGALRNIVYFVALVNQLLFNRKRPGCCLSEPCV
jgi:hypothetical protein